MGPFQYIAIYRLFECDITIPLRSYVLTYYICIPTTTYVSNLSKSCAYKTSLFKFSMLPTYIRLQALSYFKQKDIIFLQETGHSKTQDKSLELITFDLWHKKLICRYFQPFHLWKKTAIQNMMTHFYMYSLLRKSCDVKRKLLRILFFQSCSISRF